VESALGRLLAIVENYPELKSSQNVTALMDELAGTENRISVERQRYNQLVRDYNTQIKTFPTNMLAGMFGFTEKQYFQSVSGADQAPKVEF
jgi:LemA protein